MSTDKCWCGKEATCWLNKVVDNTYSISSEIPLVFGYSTPLCLEHAANFESKLPTQYGLANKKSLLIEAIKKNCLQYGDFKLSSGVKSNYFIDISKLWNSEHLRLVADLIFEAMKPFPVQVGGPELGAAPIIGALLMQRELSGFIVRKDGRIEGICKPTGTYIIEDVVTTGNQALNAVRLASNEGALILGIIAVVDREAGAKELLSKMGYNYHSLVSVKDLGVFNNE